MTDAKQHPAALTGCTRKELTGKKQKALDAQTVIMLEAQEVQAISGDKEEWWCPNPECKKVEE